MNTYFVTENYIKSITALSANIDINSIMPFIGTYQDMYIADALGSNFYSYLLNAVSAQTLSPDETALVAKIQPALAWGAGYACLPSLTYKATAKGPQVQFGDNSGQITLEELTYLRNEYKSTSEFYMERLKNFLCLSGSAFPQFINNNTTDLKPNKQTSYECEIVFRRPIGACNNCHLLNCNCSSYGVYGIY